MRRLQQILRERIQQQTFITIWRRKQMATSQSYSLLFALAILVVHGAVCLLAALYSAIVQPAVFDCSRVA